MKVLQFWCKGHIPRFISLNHCVFNQSCANTHADRLPFHRFILNQTWCLFEQHFPIPTDRQKYFWLTDMFRNRSKIFMLRPYCKLHLSSSLHFWVVLTHRDMIPKRHFWSQEASKKYRFIKISTFIFWRITILYTSYAWK